MTHVGRGEHVRHTAWRGQRWPAEVLLMMRSTRRASMGWRAPVKQGFNDVAVMVMVERHRQSCCSRQRWSVRWSASFTTFLLAWWGAPSLKRKHGKLLLGSCCGSMFELLQRWSRSTVELLLLLRLELPLLVLWMVLPILLLVRSAQLTLRWDIHHAVHRRSTAGTTTDRGSRHQQRSSATSLDQWRHSPIHCMTGWLTDPSALTGGW
jgi:hypothetical protein